MHLSFSSGVSRDLCREHENSPYGGVPCLCSQRVGIDFPCRATLGLLTQETWFLLSLLPEISQLAAVESK